MSVEIIQTIANIIAMNHSSNSAAIMATSKNIIFRTPLL